MNTIKLIRFRWLLPAVYLAAVLVQIVGMVAGAGHTPHALDFIFYVLSWPSYVVDLLLPRAGTRNPLVNLGLFLVIGVLTYSTLGFLIDMAIHKYRHRRMT